MSVTPNGVLDLTLAAGQQVKLSAAVFMSDASLEPIPQPAGYNPGVNSAFTPIQWTTSDPTKVQFQRLSYENAEITLIGLAAGSCTVTATLGTFSQTINVTVVAAVAVAPIGLIVEAGLIVPQQTQPTTQPTD